MDSQLEKQLKKKLKLDNLEYSSYWIERFFGQKKIAFNIVWLAFSFAYAVWILRDVLDSYGNEIDGIHLLAIIVTFLLLAFIIAYAIGLQEELGRKNKIIELMKQDDKSHVVQKQESFIKKYYALLIFVLFSLIVFVFPFI